MAALELIGAIAGLIPIGDLLKSTTKVITSATTIFVAFKTIKALSKVSGNIYSKIVNWVKSGWKFLWDDVLNKFSVKNADNINVGEIDANGVPDIKNLLFKSIIDVASIK